MNFNGHIPVELIESIKQKKCVLFVGSGISASVKRSNGDSLPTWHSFLLELLKFAELKNIPFWNEASDIKEIIEKYNYEIAAQELQEMMSLGDLSEFLNLIFRDKNVKPTKIHELLVKIPFRSILTSNYDNLIEGAFTLHNKGQLPQKFIPSDLNSISSPLRKDDFFIFKIHGDIDRPESIVLGSESYNHLLFKSPEYISFLQTLFTTHTVLFIGFGGSDTDIDYVINRLATIFSKTLHKHFILLPENKYNLTEKRRLLKDKRIEVIDYEVDESHSQIIEFFKEIQDHINDEKEPQKINSPTINLPKSTKYTYLGTAVISSEKFHASLKQRDNSLFYFGIDRWNFQISGKNEHLFMIKSNINLSKKLIVIIDDDFMKSKRLESILEYLIINEQENKIKLFFIVVGDIIVPSRVLSKWYYRMDSNNVESLEEELKSIIEIINLK